jgi:Fe2+ or Zn2+ uptake regulation protein
MTAPEKDTTIEDYQEPDIKSILEKAGKSEKPPEMSRPEPEMSRLEDIGTNEMSRLPLGFPARTREACLYVLNEFKEQFSIKKMLGVLKNRGLEVNFEQVKKSMNRLVEEGLVNKSKIMGISHYELSKHKEVEPIETTPEILEEQIVDFITEDKGVIPNIHKIIMVLKKESAELIHRDILGGRRLGATLTPAPETITIGNLTHVILNTMHPESIYQRWARTSIPEQTKEISGGFQEDIKITEQTGFIGTMKAQLYGTGTLWLSFDFSEHPIEFTRWREFEQWLTGIMQGRCSYGFLELTKWFTMSTFEWSIDKQVRRMDASAKYALTVSDLDDNIYARYYAKEIDGESFIRHEVGLNEEMPYTKWMEQTQALLFGGKGLQWAVKSQHQFEQFMVRTSNYMVDQSRVNRNQAQMIEKMLGRMENQDEINKELLVYLRKKKEVGE